MALIERTKTLQGMIDSIETGGIDQDNLQKLATRAKQLGDQATKLRTVGASVRLLEENGIRIPRKPQPSKELRARLSQIISGVQNGGWVGVVKDSALGNKFLEPLANHESKTKEVALTAWASRVDECVPSTDDSLLEVMEKVGFAEAVKEIREWRGVVMVLRGAVPSSAADFKKIEEAAARMTALWGELRGVPEPIVKFLSKASRRSATFDDLSDQVKDWLRTNGVLPKLRIGFL